MQAVGKIELSEVIRAMTAGDPHAMPKLYELTSRALYGKLMELLAVESLAATALKATYLKIWKYRAEFGKIEGQEFHLMAALAHQCALEIRFSTNRNDGGLSMDPPARNARAAGWRGAEPEGREKQDEALLKAAYLRFERPEALAERWSMTPVDVRARLTRLARGEGGHRDE